MSREYSATGGARVGWGSATWPFASLRTVHNELLLSVLIFGKYRFTPEQVVSLETYGLIPVLGRGIRIHHSVHEYPTKIVFWYLGSPHRVLRGIRETGFAASGTRPVQSTRSGIPVRLLPAAVMILLWNALLYLDYGFTTHGEPGPGTLAALFLFTAVPIGIRHWPPMRGIFMKEGRSPREVGALLTLLPVISGSMFAIFLVLYLSGAR